LLIIESLVMAGATPKTSWFSLDWPVYEIRETFFSYLGENQYAKLSSTPVIPIDDPKVPLIHICLNRFKGALNGTGSHRACFSLRCIVTSSGDVIEQTSEATQLTIDLQKSSGVGLLGTTSRRKPLACYTVFLARYSFGSP
jgi:hypothetical protein